MMGILFYPLLQEGGFISLWIYAKVWLIPGRKERKMGLIDDILGKLVDIKFSLDSGQIGAVNIKTENKTFVYNIQIPDPETAQAFAKELIPPELQKKIKEDVRKRLEQIAPTLEKLSDSTAVEFVAATTGLSAVEAFKIKRGGELTTAGTVHSVKIDK
jgi:hypothetical protein